MNEVYFFATVGGHLSEEAGCRCRACRSDVLGFPDIVHHVLVSCDGFNRRSCCLQLGLRLGRGVRLSGEEHVGAHRPLQGGGDFPGCDVEGVRLDRGAFRQLGRGFESRSDDGDADFFLQGGIVPISPDDFGGGARLVLDVVGDLGDLVHQDFLRTVGDVEQDEVGARDVAVVQEGGFQRLGDGDHGTAFSAGAACAHDGGSAVAHDRLDVVHVDVDVSGQRDDLGDALGGRAEHFVRIGERLLEGEVAEQLPELVVADHKEGVDRGAHFLEAFTGLRGAAASLEVEGDRDDAHGEDAEVLAGLGDDRCGARSRSAAHAGGDEDHGRVVAQLLEHVIEVFDGGVAPCFRYAACALSGGQRLAELDAHGNTRGIEGLVVGVAHDEIDTIDALFMHVVDGVGSAATDTDDLDGRA